MQLICLAMNLNKIISNMILRKPWNLIPMDQMTARKGRKPLIERVSKQVADLNWLPKILMDKELAEERRVD